ncbi:unnamed protein product [Parajaminaea phylloscopi]
MTSLRPLVTPPPVGDPCGGFHSTSGRKRPKWRSYPIHAVCETDETPARHPPATSAASTSAGLEKPSRKDKQSLNYVLRSGFAGGVAGCVAKTAIAPLDRVKILFQAQNPEFQKYSGHWLGVFRAGKDIVSSQGVPALFKGHSATLMRIFPYAAIKYMAYDKLHFALMPTRELETSSRLFVAGAASGVLSVFLTYPLELIRVRLAFETKSSRGASSAAAPFDGRTRGSLSRIVRQIYTEGSTEAPFSVDARRRAARAKSASHGAAGSAHSSSPASSGSAHTQPPSGQYQSSRHLATTASLWQAATRPPGIAQAQAEALAAGASASSPVPPSAPTTTLQTADSLLQRYPLMKFYRGFSVTVLGMIPYAGTSFLVFGRCKRGLQRAFGVDDGPTDGVTRPSQHKQARWQPSKTTIDLSSGALAGAISQTAAYPFEVVRRRQQVAALVRPGGMVGMVETTMWIWKTSGFKGFYTGLSIGFLKVVPMTSVSFAVWLGMKRWMQI